MGSTQQERREPLPSLPELARLPVVPTRHYGRWVTGAIVVVLVAFTFSAVIGNSRFRWDVVLENFTSESIVEGILTTLQLTLVSIVLGFALGAILAVMRLSKNPVLVTASWTYTWLFRAVPILVQLFLWYNLASLIPGVSMGIPFGPTLFTVNTQEVISPYSAAVIALVMHQGAYAAEIIRAGLLSVHNGQLEAAKALGLTRLQTMRRVVLPQAMRAIIPPAGNEIIGQLKTTSVVSVIALQDVLYSAQVIYQRSYQVIPLLLVAALWYLVLTSILSIGQYFVERHYGRGLAAVTAPPWTRLSAFLRRVRRTQREPGEGSTLAEEHADSGKVGAR
jgi:polar amino acid transport system permease protein